MKKILIPLVVILLLPVSALASFQDVSTAYPYYNAVNYVQTEGIVQGYADGTFKPAALINRAEFTKIIINSLYPQEKITACTTPAKNLSDVSAADWFHPYVCTALNEGIINGYPDGTFKPGNPINFAEACKILISAYDISSTAIGGAWYQQYIDAFKSKGTKPASITSPEQQMTRGETAEMIYQLKGSIPVWAKESTTSTPGTPTTGAMEEVKSLFTAIGKLTKLDDYYPYLSKAKLDEIKNLVSMITVEAGDPFAQQTIDSGKNDIKSFYLPGNIITTAPIVSISDTDSYRKVVVSETANGYTGFACVGLKQENGSWKIDDYYMTMNQELLNDKCKTTKADVELLVPGDLIPSSMSYSSEYGFKAYLNGYLIMGGGGIGGGVRTASLPLKKGTNSLRIEMGESLKQYVKADDPMASMTAMFNGLTFKIETDGKTLVDTTQSTGNTVKTIDFTY